MYVCINVYSILLVLTYMCSDVLSAFVCVFVCMCVYLCVCVCRCVCVCACACVCACMYVCVVLDLTELLYMVFQYLQDLYLIFLPVSMCVGPQIQKSSCNPS